MVSEVDLFPNEGGRHWQPAIIVYGSLRFPCKGLVLSLSSTRNPLSQSIGGVSCFGLASPISFSFIFFYRLLGLSHIEDKSLEVLVDNQNLDLFSQIKTFYNAISKTLMKLSIFHAPLHVGVLLNGRGGCNRFLSYNQ